MTVADTSYLVEAILRDASLLEDQTFIAPDLALYEVVNVIWKHETIIRDLKDAPSLVAAFLALISAETIQLLRPDEKLLKHSYSLSVKHGVTVYDSIFIALALELGSELKTFDDRQHNIFLKEIKS